MTTFDFLLKGLGTALDPMILLYALIGSALMLWGLLPEWSKDPLAGLRPFNARAETVADKPSFRGAWRHRRCLLPASGFYEWQAVAGGKQPWYVSPRDAPFFAFAVQSLSPLPQKDTSKVSTTP